MTRLLATENVILPPEPLKSWEWDFDLLERYQRKVLLWANRTTERVVPYNLSPYRKLGRYAIAISNALIRDGRLADRTAAERWLKQLRKDLINALIGFRVLQAAGRRIDGKVPYGVRLDSFTLHPLGGQVSRCRSCAYVMSDALLGVCVRCGQDCERVNADDISNYYRLAAIHALPDSPVRRSSSLCVPASTLHKWILTRRVTRNAGSRISSTMIKTR